MDPIHQITNFSPIAYLDGGSGSLMIQVLIASSVTAIYTVKTKWALLMASLSSFRNRNTNTKNVN